MDNTKEETNNSNKYKYFAFISYNYKDVKWGKRVQRKLEHYRMPATLCSERGWKRTPINPVFFAPTDIQPGPLSEELKERLAASRNLIVICSPNSAQSEWVGKEIKYFHGLGRTKNIHFFIVDGIPHSGDPATECFNPVIESIGLPEILGANIHEKVSHLPWINKERAYVQLISKLLDVEFDAIWQRHKRLMIQKTISWILGIMAVLATLFSVWITNLPVEIKMGLSEMSVHNEDLPPLKNAILTMTFENETKTCTIASLDTYAVFKNVPHKFIGKPVHISFRCDDFADCDTTLLLAKDMKLNIERNPKIYGDIHFYIWNDLGEGVANVRMNIAGYEVVSDENGLIRLFIPLEKQKKKYHFAASVPLANDTIYMPCCENNIIRIR